MSSGFKVQGFIKLELVRKDGVTVTVKKNTITNAGKQFLLDRCAGNIMRFGGSTFGMTAAYGTISPLASSSATYNLGDQDFMLSNILANLGAEQSSLSESTTFVNLFDENLVDATKIVGLGRNNISPMVPFEGLIDYSLGTYIADPFTVCCRWKYPEGIASGTIDTILMAPAPAAFNWNQMGIRAMKLLDRLNVQDTNFGNLSTSFLPPGISGYTSASEILLNYDINGNNRWKYNFSTGEVTSLSSGDKFATLNDLGATGTITDYYVEGNYLYTASYSSSTVYFQAFDITNNMNRVARLNQSFGSGIVCAKIITVNSRLFVTVMMDSTSDAGNHMFEVTKGSQAYYGTKGSVYDDYSELGVTLPSGVTVNRTCFGMYGDSYVMYKMSEETGFTTEDIRLSIVGLVCNSLSAIATSIQGLISALNPDSILFSTTSGKGVLQIGTDMKTYAGIAPVGLVESGFCMKNQNDETQTQYQFNDSGVFLSLDGQWSNVMSFVKLDSPIEKGDNDVLYVSYGYKVV